MKQFIYIFLAFTSGMSLASPKTDDKLKVNSNSLQDALPEQEPLSNNKDTPEVSEKEESKSATPKADSDVYVPFIQKDVVIPTYIDNHNTDFKLTPHRMKEVFSFKLNNYWLLNGLATVLENGDTFLELKYIDQDFLGASNPDLFKKINNKVYLVINHEYISLLNEETLQIEATLPQNYFKDQNLSFTKSKKNQAEPISAFYFNYALAGNPNEFSNSLNGQFDINYAHKDNWLLRNNFAMDESRQFHRGATVWTKEFNNKYKLTIGDISNTTINNFSSINIFGLKVSSPYYTNINNNEGIIQTMNINGYSVNPGKLDIYLNDRLYQSTNVTTGNYNLTIPKMDSGGFGIAKAVTYDKLGNPIIVEIPFFADNQLIKKGAFEYEVSTGIISDTNKNPNFAYSLKPTLAAQSLIGVTDNYTQKLFMTTSEVYSALGGTSTFFAGKHLGKVSVDWGYNSFKQGYAGLDYQLKPFKNFSLGFRHARALGDDFCFGYTNSCLKNSSTVSSSLFLGDFGSLSLNYNNFTGSIGATKNISLQYNKQLTQKLSFFANISRNTNQNPITNFANNSISFALTYNFDGKGSLSSSAQKMGNRTIYQNVLNVNENLEKPWLGYGSLSSSSSNSQSYYNAFYGANLNNLSYNINANRADSGKTTFSGNVSGGLYYVPSANKFGLSKNISSGLALVEVTNTTGPVAIMHENKHSGFTDKNGFYAVPNVIPHNQETIAININNLPETMIVNEHTKDVVVPSNGALKVTFEGAANPYLIRLYGIEEGTVITMDKELYVVGTKGRTTVAKEGPLQIEYAPGKICELQISRATKDYYCGAATPENKFPDKATDKP